MCSDYLNLNVKCQEFDWRLGSLKPAFSMCFLSTPKLNIVASLTDDSINTFVGLIQPSSVWVRQGQRQGLRDLWRCFWRSRQNMMALEKNLISSWTLNHQVDYDYVVEASKLLHNSGCPDLHLVSSQVCTAGQMTWVYQSWLKQCNAVVNRKSSSLFWSKEIIIATKATLVLIRGPMPTKTSKHQNVPNIKQFYSGSQCQFSIPLPKHQRQDWGGRQVIPQSQIHEENSIFCI